jgi:hypothetical protein
MELFFEKLQNLIFLGGISKFLKLIVFGQISAILGRFCCIGSGLRACPKPSLNLKNPQLINYESKIYMECFFGSYHPYLVPQKVSKKSTNTLQLQHPVQKYKKPK